MADNNAANNDTRDNRGADTNGANDRSAGDSSTYKDSCKHNNQMRTGEGMGNTGTRTMVSWTTYTQTTPVQTAIRCMTMVQTMLVQVTQ